MVYRHGLAAAAVRILLAAAVAIGLGACTEEDGGDAAGSSSITMLDNSFGRDVTRIPVGGTVRFRNDGQDRHNAIAVGGAWSTIAASGDEEIAPDESVTLTVDEPGVYEYFCSFHISEGEDGDLRGMVATLVVGDADVQADSDGQRDPPVREWTGTTRRVPQDFPSISNAVDAAQPGDLVLIDEGVYPEQVDVSTPYVTLRGVDRHDVIIDGQFQRPNGIAVAATDGVAVENLTVRNATQNGVFFTGLRGYRTSYVSALNNGVYGIYAFDSTDGVFEHSYAAASPDAGFYIGQCDPCEGAITDSVAEWNALGYSGTNASGVWLVDSIWRHNVAGIVPNTLDSELLPPVKDVTIAGNLVHDNSNADAPALKIEWPSFGNGIVIAGGLDSTVTRNLVVNHDRAGVLVTPNVQRNVWMSSGNRVVDNDIRASGVADIAQTGVAGPDNCYTGNTAGTTRPPGLQVFAGCDGGLRLPVRYDIGGLMTSLGLVTQAELDLQPDNDYTTAPTPAAADQPDMPGGADAPVRPAVDVFSGLALHLNDITTPQLPDDVVPTTPGVLSMFGVPVFASVFSVLFGLYGQFLPFALYSAWVALAIWDIARRTDLSRGVALAWLAVILLVPFLGPVLYHFASRSPIPLWLRSAVVGGGFLVYLVILGVGAAVGGLV